MDAEKENDNEESKEDSGKEMDIDETSNAENNSNPADESEENSEITDLNDGERNVEIETVEDNTSKIVPLQNNEDNLVPVKKIQINTEENHTKADVVKQTDVSKNPSKGNQKEEIVNGKKKVREGKPFTKIVIRRLPPTMTKDVFLDQVSPLPPFDYFYFVPAYTGGFSRAYINFINQNDLFDFTRTFDNYVFIDSKGHEYPAIVEFAPYQRVPKARPGRKKDHSTGTLETDAVFVTFKEQLQAEELENSRTTNKQHYFETEINESEEVVTTPLLEFLKARRAEKDRIREERREDRKRKEAERKLLKQKIKDKPMEEETEIKVLQPPKEKKEFTKEKDAKRVKHKEKEDRFVKPENRSREFKNKGGKSYREERLKQAEKREEKKKKESEEDKEIKDEVAIEEEIKEEEKYWSDKKKWKYGGSGDSKSGRTFTRRRDEKRKEFDKKRGTAKPHRTRKGSGESNDESIKKENSSESSDKTLAVVPSEKTDDKKSVNSPKKEKELALKQEDTNSKEKVNAAQKSTKEDAKDIIKNEEKENKNKENKKKEKENVPSADGNKKDRLQKESSVDSEEGGKPTKDPRAERRIRNKDRPSIEIYRPGMGKFSRQRLEKEKTLGSTDESPSHSPSPTPNNSTN